ncbi:S49 family peptidase (plasmid) [Vibrio scophthalmi]|uniref:S49 family peptidase n=1 Tax=Vibrio scophthalmi TaxID=45658 RepID=UPI003EB699B8
MWNPFKKNDSPVSLRDRLKEFSKLYKSNHRFNQIKVAAIVLGVGFGITHTLYMTHYFNMPVSHIALIQFEGPVQRGSKTGDGTILSEAIQKAMNDPLAQVVYIEANSPGGSPVQAEILHRTIMNMRNTTHKPIIFSIGEMCASACLYVASAADVVYAHANSLIGSVGVRMDSWYLEDFISKFDIERRTFTAGRNKAFLDPFQPMTKQAQSHLNNNILEPLYGEFKKALREGRGEKLNEDNPDLYTGFIWTGSQAVEIGFADELRTHFEVREQIRETYQVKTIQNYTQPSFSFRKMLTAEFWADVVAQAAVKVQQQSNSIELK